jgi:Flp pilus assembly protein TadD
MILFELIRIHTRTSDYRNALRICERLKALAPQNPHVLSRCGRLCLEMGRRSQAVEFFRAVTDLKSNEPEVKVLECLNEGFVFIYDGAF